ncbi:Crp/Fnr family transcriptional regulator [Nitrogeniibacter mangrovi]|uniref:Crp/Fnr family transcriptional regulator n=1 Tax=Nitrogeniibacter mangrovi TaxID=2016596 RepID=A0A6C1B1M6_9RHOO|nr:Crp/Fnr family transcriptional regulator [Nitrogeniibacter mangrovi]QID16815.1 Crp/Fnr family transcriptional regulator [Nitrogeniibacter mangrovi]
MLRHQFPPGAPPRAVPPDDGQPLARQLGQGLIDAASLARFLGLSLHPAPHPEWARFQCRRFRPGEVPIRAGDPCRYLYVVIRGSVCTRVVDAEGAERIIGFERAADSLGLDGLASGRHTTEAIVLEPTDMVVIPLAGLARPGHEGAALGSFIYRLLGRQILRDQAAMAMMAASRATTRLGAFLLDWYQRSETPARTVALPMSRMDIASFLGLSKETVSRACSALDRAGIVAMRRRRFTILDPAALHRTAAGAIACEGTPVRGRWRELDLAQERGCRPSVR